MAGKRNKRTKQEKAFFVIAAIVIILIIANNQSGRLSRAAIPDLSANYGANVDFNDPEDPWKDTTGINTFNPVGSVTYLADDPECLWYGCALFQGDETYLKTFSEYSFEEDGSFAVELWVKHNVKASGDVRPGYFWWKLGPNSYDDGITAGEDNQGMQWGIRNITGGKVGTYYSWPNPTRPGDWNQYFFVYDAQACTMTIYHNGGTEMTRISEDRCAGELADVNGLEMRLGAGRYWNSGDFYLDEVTVYKDISGINEDYVKGRYDLKRAGTPPEVDVYVKAIKYDIPYDYSQEGNPLITGGTMPITIELANAGVQDSGSFGYDVRIETGKICSGTTSIGAGEVVTIECDWDTTVGYHQGYVTLDITDEVEENNQQRLYIPFLDRPYYHYTEQEWDDYIAYADQFFNDGSVLGNSVGWMSHFGCSGWVDGWTGSSVDPYGPKALECAMGCAYNDWTSAPNKGMCENAFEHLHNWLALDVDSYQGVQQIHYLNFVGMTYDLLQSHLTEEEDRWARDRMEALAQHVTNYPDARPDKDNPDTINGGNGWGFGSGLGGFTYNAIGLDPENPTLIQDNPLSYWGKNIPDLWMSREDAFLEARKDEPFSFYQEGVGYKWYAEALNFMSNMYFRKKYDLGDIDQYNNAFCAMARENIVTILDFNYNGQELRNSGYGTMARQISRGDGASYNTPQGMVGWDVLLLYGYMCDDMQVKEEMMWLREHIQEVGDTHHSYFASFAYSELLEQTNGKVSDPNEDGFPRFLYDNANDIYVLRDGYTYSTDTMLLIDGGEERGGGHSQAQGYMLYINGVPFFDYEQVPYNDDVRTDPWKNGVSFVNAPQTEAGKSGLFLSTLGSAGYNQYFGGGEAIYYSTDYPEWRKFPFEYGGDIEDYVGTEDGYFGGAYVWRPYENADAPVQEYFVKFGDLVAKRTVVKGAQFGEVYHNFININNEMDMTIDGETFTLNADGTWVKTQVAWSDVPMTLGGGDSGVQVCYCKTSCTGSCGGTSNYRRMYFKADSADADFIITHSWNTGTPPEVTTIGDVDKGVRQGTKVIVFDTNGDGKVEYGNWETDGWALAFDEVNDQAGAFNATYVKKGVTNVLSAQSDISMYVDGSFLTKNTAKLNEYMDRETQVVVSVNGIPDGPVCTPSTEVCDGVDNDCDDLVDEYLQRTCSENGNVGIQECANGGWDSCEITTITTYSCLDNACALDINGLYSSAQNCIEACVPQEANETGSSGQKLSDIAQIISPATYNYYTCSKNGMCVESDNGAYITSNCNNECIQPPANNYSWLLIAGGLVAIYLIAVKGRKIKPGRRKRKFV